MNTAMILAAGRGTRMRPLTDTLPKPLICLAGKPLIVHLIERLAKANFRKIVINICYLGEKIQACLGNGSQWDIEIIYSVESPDLETGGGIVNALPLLGQQPFVVLSGDIFTDFDFSQLKRPLRSLGHLLLAPGSAEQSKNFDLSGDGWLLNKPSFTYANIGVFTPAFFADCVVRRFPLRELLIPAIEAKCLTGEVYSGIWWNIGDVEQLTTAERMLANTDLLN